MAEKAYQVKVGAFAGQVEGDVLRPSDYPHIPRERFRELASRGVLEELSPEEAAILDTNKADSDREVGAVEDQFADQTRGDALRLAARIDSLETDRRKHREEIDALNGQLADMTASLQARSAGQAEQAKQAAAAAGVTLPEAERKK